MDVHKSQAAVTTASNFKDRECDKKTTTGTDQSLYTT